MLEKEEDTEKVVKKCLNLYFFSGFLSSRLNNYFCTIFVQKVEHIGGRGLYWSGGGAVQTGTVKEYIINT